jgi:hypothetical protein
MPSLLAATSVLTLPARGSTVATVTAAAPAAVDVLYCYHCHHTAVATVAPSVHCCCSVELRLLAKFFYNACSKATSSMCRTQRIMSVHNVSELAK